MLINRKDEQKLARKPARFNLGGLIKKKITWKRSIDSLASPGDLLDFSASAVEPDSYAAYPDLAAYDSVKNYTHMHTPEERYTSFTTECISLQNSDMTSHMEEEDAWDAQDEFVPFDAKSEEAQCDYKPGGYHPVKLCDEFGLDKDRYRVLRKLGWGHFSTVWLAESQTLGQYVALKIVKLGKNYLEAAADEIRILRGLQKNGPHKATNVVTLLDNFSFTGPNGVHAVMIFELMGENMLHLIYKHKAPRKVKPSRLLLLPMPMVKLIVHQLLLSVDNMHRNGVIHTDLKPENILLTHEGELSEAARHATPNNNFQILPLRPLMLSLEAICANPVNVKVADLGNATYSKLHFTNHIQTRQYRAPEIILRHGTWGALADVWLVGCLIFELLTGDYLFDPHDGQSFDKDEDHLAQVIELLGEFPSATYLLNCENTDRFFETPKSLVNIRTLKFWLLESVLVEKYKLAFDDDLQLACDLILKCLKYDLSERYDCGLLMAHPWFREEPVFNQQEVDTLPNNNKTITGFTREE